MKILVDLGHPKEANIFKNVVLSLENRGHTVKIVARDKENTIAILNSYGFDYELGQYYKGLAKKALGVVKNDLMLYTISKKFKPDIFVGSPYAAHVSRLFRKPHIGLSDTEIANIAIQLMLPFTDVVLTPSCFDRDLGPKQVRFNSYYELAYLHPNYFKPDSSVLEKLNLDKNDKYILLRFSSLGAHHDIGVEGFNFKSSEEMHKFIRKIEVYGRVFLTSEIKLGIEFEKYKANVPSKDFHNLISFATMYMGEGASMAAEAAILGVPSIYVSTTRRGYLDELEEKYGLAFTVSNKDKALKNAMELLNDKDTKNRWQRKKEIMLNEKVDVTKFMVDVIEKWGNRSA